MDVHVCVGNSGACWGRCWGWLWSRMGEWGRPSSWGELVPKSNVAAEAAGGTRCGESHTAAVLRRYCDYPCRSPAPGPPHTLYHIIFHYFTRFIKGHSTVEGQWHGSYSLLCVVLVWTPNFLCVDLMLCSMAHTYQRGVVLCDPTKMLREQVVFTYMQMVAVSQIWIWQHNDRTYIDLHNKAGILLAHCMSGLVH